MSEPSEDDVLSAIACLAQTAAAAPVTSEVSRHGRQRIVGKVALVRPRARTSRFSILVVAAALAVTATVWMLRPRNLAYEVKGMAMLDSPYISAPADTPVEVVFSDGSEVHADPGTHLRVDSTHANGARLVLERGSATAQVRHRDRSRWRFAAGPFEVRVTGTRLALAWDSAKEELDLRVYEGSVEVTSPLNDPLPVRAGQRYHAALPTRSMSLLESGDPASVAPSHRPREAPEPLPAASDDASAPEGAAHERLPSTHPAPASDLSTAAPGKRAQAPRRDSWAEMVARGDYQGVVTAGEARGIDACSSTCSAVDLRSLADAARYAGRSELAGKCLLALRGRFSGSEEGARAAFLLGRTSENGGQQAAAERWYDTYLVEAPRGSFAAEALAGKVRSVMATRGAAAAKPFAVDYVHRYSDGVHAKAMRRIAGAD